MTPASSTAESEPFTFEVPPPGPYSFEAPSMETFSFEAPSMDSFSFERAPSERREKAREVIRVQARLRIDGDPPLDVHTVDLSAHGLAVTSTRPLNVGLECNVELGISVPEIARPPELRASIRYCARLRDDQFRIGMRFTTVSVEAAELIVAVLGL
jgi:hypothetical protein